MTREVVSIEREDLGDALFELPSGYRKIDQVQPMMPAMPGMQRDPGR
jgi:hypothetical protein